ncbi:flagellar biosynthesis protein FlaG [Salibacterium salarium]|uniref:Flagellar biosynthesis protein FlaG n=1 Tax=Salibacterium salarium TaxID=284579 RepID=A0A3R9QGF2_9BACI|nr:flagellar protein FlaG [Salibacterium salarium]RSL29970.1 flagellar biosynthesis protein FlaG [Salibacterium salarium]
MGVHVSDIAKTSDTMLQVGYSSGGQKTMDRLSPLENIQQDTKNPSGMLPDSEELQKQADGVNEMLEATHTNLKFNVHDKLDQVFVQVLERGTEEVIREIPPEKFLDVKASMLEQAGLLVDEKV